MKISVIVPVYNVERYIRRSLQSVAAQDYGGEIECIIVDDASPDGSIALARQFIGSYTGPVRFSIITHPANGGLSAARNTGIRHATGDYIYLLDSDDELTPAAISSLASLASAHPGVDIVQGNLVADDPLFSYLETSQYRFPAYTADREWIACHMVTDIPGTAWNKLIRRTFITDNNLWFVEGVIHEDDCWRYQAYRLVRSMAFSSHKGYIYRMNDSSITRNPLKDKSFRSMLVAFGIYLPTITETWQYVYVLTYLAETTRKLTMLADPEGYMEALRGFIGKLLAGKDIPADVKPAFAYILNPTASIRIMSRLCHRRSHRLIKHLRPILND